MVVASKRRYVAYIASTKFIFAKNFNFTFSCHYECSRGFAGNIFRSPWLVPAIHTAYGRWVARGEADVTLKVTLWGRWKVR